MTQKERPPEAPLPASSWRRRRLLLLLTAQEPRPLPAARTLALSAVLLAVAVALCPTALSAPVGAWVDRADRVGPVLQWWQLVPVFAAAGIFVFHVEINSEAHTFSLSEVPVILALFFASPRDLFLARLIGEALILVVYERQTLSKLAFNLSVFCAETSLALAVFRYAGAGVSALGPRAWLAAWVSVGAGSLLAATSVWFVIRLHGGRAQARELFLAAGVTTTCNASLAVVAAVLLVAQPSALVPFLLVAGLVVAAYRSHTRLTKRYAGLNLLYQFTRLTAASRHPDETLGSVLNEARTILRADRAIIGFCAPGEADPWLVTQQPEPLTGAWLPPPMLREVVLDRSETMIIPSTTKDPRKLDVLRALGAADCLAAPLVTGGVATGFLAVCDRLGQVSTFDAEDAHLFATLASQAAIALENGRLIERLHEQVRAREHEALHDALTGLPNRLLLARTLDAALAVGSSRPVGVLLMDLDGFKEINDSLGHHTGDDVLCQVAVRIQQVVGDLGVVARLGGDEFAVVVPDLPTAGHARTMADGIRTAIRRPIDLSTLTLEVGVSIGVVTHPDHGDDATMLMQRADVAMYAAKRERVGVTVYDESLDDNGERRLRIAVELRHALLARQLEVHYQPIARTADRQIVGVEALARWTHPTLGMIRPDEFIPIAEHSRLIHELTTAVLDAALAQVRAWNRTGLDLNVAVNLSIHVLRDADWPAKVAHVLHLHGVPARQLTFEITESAAMTDPDHVIRMLGELARTGVTFSVDDFGTGYSSLAYLQRLPISKIKIDKSFVIPLTTDPAAATIVHSVIDMARNLNLTVIAEGVEDQRTLDHLAAHDCHLVQGYYLSRPIPGPQLTTWLTLNTDDGSTLPSQRAPQRRSSSSPRS